jgi:bifunctional non-homologous end joining protein LigD
MHVLRFIEPCLPSPADRPPFGSNWIHEIKHDGYRLMARRDSVGICLITRRGNDWSSRFPLVVEAVNHLKVRSCLVDGEVVCCDDRGLAIFQLLGHRRNEPQAFLYAFDLLELNGDDLRREPIEVRWRRWPVSCARAGQVCASTNTWSTQRVPSCSSAPARWGWKGSSRSGWDRVTDLGVQPDWLKFKNPEAPAVKREAEEDWGR